MPDSGEMLAANVPCDEAVRRVNVALDRITELEMLIRNMVEATHHTYHREQEGTWRDCTHVTCQTVGLTLPQTADPEGADP